MVGVFISFQPCVGDRRKNYLDRCLSPLPLLVLFFLSSAPYSVTFLYAVLSYLILCFLSCHLSIMMSKPFPASAMYRYSYNCPITPSTVPLFCHTLPSHCSTPISLELSFSPQTLGSPFPSQPLALSSSSSPSLLIKVSTPDLCTVHDISARCSAFPPPLPVPNKLYFRHAYLHSQAPQTKVPLGMIQYYLSCPIS